MHQRGEAEFAQERSVDVERPRLRHRERRDVHHVRERVVVVLLQCRQRHQRGAVLSDQLREAVDDLPRGGRIGLVAGLGGFPQRLGGFDRRRVHAAGGRDAGLFVGHLFDDDAAERHVADASGREAVGERRRRRPVAEDGDEVPDLVARETARQRDLLDAALAQIAREADERRGPARQAVAVDDDFVADEADDDGRRRLERFGRGGIQGIESALHEGVVRRIELGAPQRCRKPAYQFLGLLDMQVSF